MGWVRNRVSVATLAPSKAELWVDKVLPALISQDRTREDLLAQRKGAQDFVAFIRDLSGGASCVVRRVVRACVYERTNERVDGRTNERTNRPINQPTKQPTNSACAPGYLVQIAV